MSVNELIGLVRNYLASHHMFADNEWLAGCVEYLTLDISTNYNKREIQNLAKEQWLLNDLKDICPGSLPANLKHQQKIMLTGKYALQINAVVDIGTPAYQQYLKLQKVNTENIEATTKFEEKVSNLRMIKLYLTDGVQEISGIEYKPMRNLSCDITPGCKVLIKGPIECRRGVLLLTESLIELLGGEVQEIAASNSLAGLLSSKLGLPMTMTQGTDTCSTISHPRNSNVPVPHTQMPSATEDNQNVSVDQTSRPIARVTSIQVADNFVDDDIDIDELAALEAQINSNPGKRPLIDKHFKPEKRQKIDPVVSVYRVDEYPEDNDLFLEEDEDHLKEMEANFNAQCNEIKIQNKTSKHVSSEPFVYIKQINDINVSDREGRVFKVKGQIMRLLSKLSVGKDGWNLRCTIIDGTGTIDVEFTSEVLSELVGYTPLEMNLLKKQMASRPELKEKAVSALQKAKDTLQVLYCIIQLTIIEEVPRITRLIPFDESHLDLLIKRMPSGEL